MLASHGEKRFVLLSNPKTGTTALEAAFEKFADIRIGGSPKWKHISYDKMTEIFGDYFQRRGCTIYAVARHPVDALASWYRYRSRPELGEAAAPWHDKYTGDISFSQFIEEWADRLDAAGAAAGDDEMVPEPRGRPAPITFYRYEDLPRSSTCCRVTSAARSRREAQRLAGAAARRRPRGVAALPRMQRRIELYDRIPFVGR